MAITSTLSQEVFNAREQLLTGDIMRLQALANRDIQNLFGDETRADQDGAFTTAQPPVSSLVNEPTWTPSSTPGNFTATIGAGSGFQQLDPGGLGPDQTPYQVLRWTPTLVSFSTPDTTNGRIDTVYLVAGMLAVDVESRNILTDPVARTSGIQSVNKTNNPATSVLVQTGVAAPIPVPPVIPAGSVALFDIYVPPSAASASIFANPLLRLNRRAPFPWSSMTGVIAGMQLQWDQQANPASASAVMSIPLAAHKIVIDGEVISWGGSFLTGQNIQADSTASPFASPAPSTNAKVYYIYAVGGRSLPRASNWNILDATFNPVILVESMQAPNPGTAVPGGSLTVLINGTPTSVSKACLIGVGYIAQNTSFRLACVMTGDMIYVAGAGLLVNVSVSGATANPALLPAIAVGSIPAGAQKAHVCFTATANAGTPGRTGIYSGSAGAISPTSLTGGTGMLTVYPAATGIPISATGHVFWPGSTTPPRWWVQMTSGFSSGNEDYGVIVHGFSHGVPRFDGMAGI